MKKQDTERQESIAKLRHWLKPGDTVYTILRHVSRSGMQHQIGIVIFRDGQPLHPNYSVAKAIGARLNKGGAYDAIIIDGCGMEMGFEIVYRLGRALWPEGFECAGSDHCHSNDHANGDRDYSPHHHSDGGYALQHRWL